MILTKTLEKKIKDPSDYVNKPELGYFADLSETHSINGLEPEPGRPKNPFLYLNHSVRPNAHFITLNKTKYESGQHKRGYTTVKGNAIVVQTLKDIPEGHEVLIHYGDAYGAALVEKYGDEANNIHSTKNDVHLTPEVVQKLAEDLRKKEEHISELKEKLKHTEVKKKKVELLRLLIQLREDANIEYEDTNQFYKKRNLGLPAKREELRKMKQQLSELERS